MPPQDGRPTPGDPAPLSLDRCPNCDRPLRFPADQAEAYCPSCGIFVEVLRPLSPKPEEAKPVDRDAVRFRSARLYLELADALDDEAPEAPHVESAISEVEPEKDLTLKEGDAVPPPTQASLADEREIPWDILDLEEPTSAEPAESSIVAALPSATRALARPRRWHRILFYTGTVLVAFGGSGLALGSVLHDVFRVPFFGAAYDAFGNLNVSAVVFGAAVLLAGFSAMAVGARAGAHAQRAVGG